MAAKDTKNGKGKAADKPKAASAPAKAKRTHVRKPALARACKQAAQLLKKATSLFKNVGRWVSNTTDTEEQKQMLADLQTDLRELCAQGGSAGAIGAALDTFAAAGWTPKTASGGRQPLAVGTPVHLKADRYKPRVHGDINDFEVLGIEDPYVLIRVAGSDDDRGLPVVRAWLETVDSKPVEAAD